MLGIIIRMSYMRVIKSGKFVTKRCTNRLQTVELTILKIHSIIFCREDLDWGVYTVGFFKEKISSIQGKSGLFSENGFQLLFSSSIRLWITLM